jgi:hypothetical protein
VALAIKNGLFIKTVASSTGYTLVVISRLFQAINKGGTIL